MMVERDDEHEAGDWSAVIQSHRRCGLGITHDTCHMHLRAHLGGETLAIFRRPDVSEWGAYPRYVTCIGPDDSVDADRTGEIARDWVRDQILSGTSAAVDDAETREARRRGSNELSEAICHVE
jgi:hypothetical protein